MEIVIDRSCVGYVHISLMFISSGVILFLRWLVEREEETCLAVIRDTDWQYAGNLRVLRTYRRILIRD